MVLIPLSVALHAGALFFMPDTPAQAEVTPAVPIALVFAESGGGTELGAGAAAPAKPAASPALAAAPRAVEATRRRTRRPVRAQGDAPRSTAPELTASRGSEASVGGPAGTTEAPSGTGADGTDQAGGGVAAQGPTLIAAFDPCFGYFPADSRAAHGEVQVDLQVGADGRPTETHITSELPRGEGFAGAARACARSLRFEPARSSSGVAISGAARLLLSFERG